MPYLIRFPARELPEASEPLPEGLEGWDFGEALDNLDEDGVLARFLATA